MLLTRSPLHKYLDIGITRRRVGSVVILATIWESHISTRREEEEAEEGKAKEVARILEIPAPQKQDMCTGPLTLNDDGREEVINTRVREGGCYEHLLLDRLAQSQPLLLDQTNISKAEVKWARLYTPNNALSSLSSP